MDVAARLAAVIRAPGLAGARVGGQIGKPPMADWLVKTFQTYPELAIFLSMAFDGTNLAIGVPLSYPIKKVEFPITYLLSVHQF